VGNGEGGGLYEGAAHLGNDIVATNTVTNGSAAGADCDTTSGSVTTMGHNLIGDLSFCSGITNGVNGDQAGTSITPLDPDIGPLSDNGGPTQTLALMSGSPAIAHGDTGLCAASPVNDADQRGYPRRSTARGTCDVGAYDTSEPTAFAVAAPSSATAGQSFTITVTAKDAFRQTLTTYLGRISFSTGDKAATLPKAYTFKAGDHGVHTFTVTLTTAGSQTVSVKDTAAKSVTGSSAAITVSP
jgi:hypothetical protein